MSAFYHEAQCASPVTRPRRARPARTPWRRYRRHSRDGKTRRTQAGAARFQFAMRSEQLAHVLQGSGSQSRLRVPRLLQVRQRLAHRLTRAPGLHLEVNPYQARRFLARAVPREPLCAVSSPSRSQTLLASRVKITASCQCAPGGTPAAFPQASFGRVCYNFVILGVGCALWRGPRWRKTVRENGSYCSWPAGWV
jgi:hypothetical protein